MTRTDADLDAALKAAKDGKTLTTEQAANLSEAASQFGERGDKAHDALKSAGLSSPRTS